MRFLGKYKPRVKAGLGVIAIALAALVGVAGFAPTTALADSGDISLEAPAHHKTISDNGDGTYDLALSVIGDAASSSYSKPIDVVVVIDVSGSMRDRSSGSRTTKLQAAKNAVKVLADTLLNDNNAALPESQQIKMSVVTFSTKSSVMNFGDWTSTENWANSSATVMNKVNSLTADGGTNWEAALSDANSLSTGRKDSDGNAAAKYVIFLSDGDPTYRNSKYNDWADDYNRRQGVYGTGNSDPNGWDYGAAKDEANKRASSVGMFVVTADSSATKMKSFATDTASTYLDGTSEDKLKAAFEQIAQTIKKSASYKDVKIVDQLSEYVDFADVVNVRYEKGTDQSTSTWTDAPEAAIDGDTLTWDLSSVGELTAGETYKVVFTIKPNQTAYDTAAAAGKTTTLPSNNGDGTNVYYKTVVHETGKGDVVSDEQSASYEEPSIKVPVNTVKVTKKWANDSEADRPESVTLYLKKNGEVYKTFTLSASDGWTKTFPVPAGVDTYTWTVSEDDVADYDTTYSDAVTGSGSLTVTNTHETRPGTLDGATNLTVTKKLTGRAWKDGDSFSFKIEQTAGDTDAVTMPESDTVTVTNETEGHKASFGDITFSAAGEYEFTISELGESHGGVAYDTAEKVVRVSVAEKDGRFVPTVTEGANPTFTNVYSTDSVDYSVTEGVEVTKVLTGRDLRAGEFEFELVDAGGNVVATAKNAADGSVSFTAQTYTAAGAYEYTVREKAGDLGGVDYDESTYKVTVAVTDNLDGTLSAEATSESGDIEFDNTYGADPAKLKTGVEVTKELIGRDWTDDDSFEFTIAATSADAPLPTTTTGTATRANKTVSFGEFTFTAAGTYTYEISETAGDLGGVDYDTHKATVTVQVVDNGKGQLIATPTVSNGTFTNKYAADEVTLVGETAIKGTKTLTGHDMVGQYGFSLTAAEDYGDKVVIAAGADSASVSGGKDGETKSFAFGAVTFKAAGTYKFNVTEVGDAPAGYTYDKHTSIVTVVVTDNGKGKLVAAVTYGDGDSCVFKNSYYAAPATVDGSANFGFEKALEGRDLNAGEFSFQIVATSNNDAPLPSETVVTNAADGSFSFGDITYTKAGTYTYEISEITDSLPGGVSAVTAGSKQVVVKVEDNNKGQLVATVTKPDDVTFKNTYKPTDAVVETLTTTKVIKAQQEGVDAPALEAGDFSFTISSSDGGALPEQTTVSNDAAGNVQFGKITFTSADLDGETSKTFHYTITESGSKAGVTNDGDKSFTITVTDNLDGAMKAEVSDIEGFVNEYSVEPVEYPVTEDVSVNKVLEGRDLAEGEFEFELVEDGEVVRTATNATDGSVYFDAIEYTLPGEHTYTVREAAGEAGGVTYDDSSYKVVVNVTDNGEGKLVATAEAEGDITFNNTYEAEPTSVTISASKVLNGAQLKGGDFTFQLASNGKVVATATNDVNGAVTFESVKFTEAGTYTYTIAEAKGNAEGVTYDETVFTATVEVTDDLEGHLSATVSYDATPVFKNTYTAPVTPQPTPKAETPAKAEIPKTGDTTQVVVPGLLLTCGAVVAATAIVGKKRNQK